MPSGLTNAVSLSTYNGRVVEQVDLWDLQCRGCAVLAHFADDLATKDAHSHKC